MVIRTYRAHIIMNIDAPSFNELLNLLVGKYRMEELFSTVNIEILVCLTTQNV